MFQVVVSSDCVANRSTASIIREQFSPLIRLRWANLIFTRDTKLFKRTSTHDVNIKLNQISMTRSLITERIKRGGIKLSLLCMLQANGHSFSFSLSLTLSLSLSYCAVYPHLFLSFVHLLFSSLLTGFCSLQTTARTNSFNV